jgi:chromosome segregation ATPase
MARGITQTDVDRAADALLANGERPTVDRVRQFLGTGSPNTVTRLLDAWWRGLSSRLDTSAARMAVPDAPDEVAQLAGQLWEQALTSARELEHAALAAERDAMAAARLEADARVAASQQAAEAAADAKSQAVQALEAALQRLEAQQALVDRLQDQVADLGRQRDDALLRGERAEATAEDLRGRLEAARLDHERSRAEAADHLRSVEDRSHAEVDRARQEAQALRTQLQSAEKAHAARARELEAQLADTRAASTAVNRDLAAERARRETLEQQLVDLRGSLEVALQPAPAARKAAPSRVRTRVRARPSK